MKALLAAATVVASLSGCALLQTYQNPVHLTQVYEAESGYDAGFLVPLTAYAKLPRCAAGTHISPANLCHEAAVLKQARAYDKDVADAFAKAVAFVNANPTLDPTAEIAALTTAVGVAENFATTSGIKLAPVTTN